MVAQRMIMSQHRIELTLAGQKFAFATSPEHETSLRAAAALVDEQLESLLTGGNRSIERAAIMTAIKLAGDLQAAKMNLSVTENPGASLDQVSALQAQVDAIEASVDAALKTLSLPGAPRPIVP
jgi:cell division protein ZapA